jgi:hypothetical protein
MTSTSSAWVGIVSLILFLGLMSGFWAGIVGLRNAKRGPAWWLMTIGVGLGTLGPILYAVGSWMLIQSMTASMSSTGTISPRPSDSSGVLMSGGLLVPAGMILFSIGFALHGFAAARMANRAEELEQLTAAMSEEINRLREGGPAA